MDRYSHKLCTSSGCEFKNSTYELDANLVQKFRNKSNRCSHKLCILSGCGLKMYIT